MRVLAARHAPAVLQRRVEDPHHRFAGDAGHVRREHDVVELVQRRLKEIREAAGGTENLLPTLRQALKDRCSMGEVCGAMRDVYGEYQPTF